MAPKSAKKSPPAKMAKPAAKPASKQEAKSVSKTSHKVTASAPKGAVKAKGTLTAIKSFFTGGVKKSAKGAPVKTNTKQATGAVKAPKAVQAKAPSAKVTAKAEVKTAPVPAAPKISKSKAAAALAASTGKPALNKTGAIKTSLRATPKEKPIHDDAVCREIACEGLGTTSGYCRLHYIRNWKKIKRKEAILKEGKLLQFIDELVSKYPEKYLEAIRMDLSDIRGFAKVVKDLELDEDATTEDFEGEGAGDDDVIDDIKRDIEDETDAF